MAVLNVPLRPNLPNLKITKMGTSAYFSYTKSRMGIQIYEVFEVCLHLCKRLVMQ